MAELKFCRGHPSQDSGTLHLTRIKAHSPCSGQNHSMPSVWGHHLELEMTLESRSCLFATSGSHLTEFSTPKSQEMRMSQNGVCVCVCVRAHVMLWSINVHANKGNVMIHLDCYPSLDGGPWKSPQQFVFWIVNHWEIGPTVRLAQT